MAVAMCIMSANMCLFTLAGRNAVWFQVSRFFIPILDLTGFIGDQFLIMVDRYCCCQFHKTCDVVVMKSIQYVTPGETWDGILHRSTSKAST